MFDKLSHVMLFVHDMKRATTWYCQNLGFAVVFGHDQFTMLSHHATGIRVDLHATRQDGVPKGRDPEAPLPYLATKTFDDTLAKLRSMGITTTEPRSEGGSPRFLSFIDSEGNAWGLEEIRAKR
jgi:catechol 2,3-dioxygenase-like lactoylglutathione lyase family enzyme